MSQFAVIGMREENCVQCHQCISVCPVKICQDASGTAITINHDLCIACGSCIDACTHEARIGLDDWNTFKKDLESGVKMVAIVAPSAAATFGKDLLRLNGWLGTLGVEAFFDVSFGADLTVHSYVKHILANKPDMVIAQPCPPIVSYIETYQPELLKYLAPADSPMLHTMKMIRTWYPEWNKHKIAVISPCLAKKREFEQTGFGDYNVTFASIEAALKANAVRIAGFPEIPYLNPLAERGAMFSTPGGLKATLERSSPEHAARTRKIEGPREIYEYFSELPESLKQGAQALVVDCLNCSKGCNGGTGTTQRHIPVDILENAVANRVSLLRKHYSPRARDEVARKKLNHILGKFWKPGLYSRKYVDRSPSAQLPMPSNAQREAIYRRMLKFKPEDFYHCASCGYQSCEKMADAIHQGLNRPENCHYYLVAKNEMTRVKIENTAVQLHEKINAAQALMSSLAAFMKQVESAAEIQGTAMEESSAAIEELLSSIQNIDQLVQTRFLQMKGLQDGTREGAESFELTVTSIQSVAESVAKILEVNETIDSVAKSTNLLAMNAAIEAAHAGHAGKGFAVVADEIRKLAEQTAENANLISTDLAKVTSDIEATQSISVKAGTNMGMIVTGLDAVGTGFQELAFTMKEMATGTNQIQKALLEMTNSGLEVTEAISRIGAIIVEANAFYQELHQLSESEQ